MIKIIKFEHLSFLVVSSTPIDSLHDDNNKQNTDEDSEDFEDVTLSIECHQTCAGNETCSTKIVSCPGKEGKRQACYSLWSSNETYTVFHNQGCMIINEEHCNPENCTDNSPEKKKNKSIPDHDGYNYCCCQQDLCNEDVNWDPIAVEDEPLPPTNNEDPLENYNWLIASFLIIGFVGVCIGTKYVYKKTKEFKEIPTSEPELSISTQCLDNRPIELLEIKAHGRFGVVYRAKLKTDDVAVKVFPSQDKNSWIQEKDNYKLPRMNHPNILYFVGAEVRPKDDKIEYWLITEYQPLGSLCDYLKSHTLNWQDMMKIGESMARGLMHLHEEIIVSAKPELSKPAIAHRDFKSKNVLLKSDLTACIADFGLAMKFTPGEAVGDVHGQVGTRRYMAPEILEGAINFNRDSFLRIDVYACGLVLWELVSRCTAHGNPVDEYRLPFEAELGSHPTHEQMQENIAAKKLRPKLFDEWRTHPVS